MTGQAKTRRRLSPATVAEISAALDGKLRPLPTKESYAGRKQCAMRAPSAMWLKAAVLLALLALALFSPLGEHILVGAVVALAGPPERRSERRPDSESEEERTER